MADKVPSELSVLRAEYKALAGKNPSPRLDADGVRAKIDELKANPGAQDAPEPPPAAKAATAKTIKMIRDAEEYPDGPHEADVHPHEVDNYAAGGWRKG